MLAKTGDELIPIEVKATGRPHLSDAKGLRVFRDEYKGASRPALLLRTGDQIEWLARGVLAAP